MLTPSGQEDDDRHSGQALDIDYQSLIRLVPLAIVVLNCEAQILYANPKATTLLGQTTQTLQQCAWINLIHPDDVVPFLSDWNDAIAAIAPFVSNHRLDFSDGNIMHIRLELVPQSEVIAGQITYVGYIQDISIQKQVAAELHRLGEVARDQSEELYTTIAEAVPVGLYRNNAEGNCIYINQKTCEILDITFEECLGHGWVDRLHPDDAERMLKSWQQAFENKTFWQDEYRFLHRDGKVIWVLAQCTFIFDEAGNNIGSIGGLTDITRQKELEQSLALANQRSEQLANQDGLTNIANRRYFDSFLVKEWKRLRREQAPIGLIMIDVDHFKHYNDTYGHTKGDKTLRAVAQTLAKTIRRPADLVARYGGEEFSVVLPNTDTIGAREVAHQITANIAKLGIPHKGIETDSRLTLSLGISCLLPDHNTSPEDLINRADQALYQAKQQGRNRTVIWGELGELGVNLGECPNCKN